MSKGNRVLTFRCPPELHDEVLGAIERCNHYRRDEQLDLTTFIRSALVEKLKKMARSRRPRPKKHARNPHGTNGE